MKISEIRLDNREIVVQLPKTDACQIILCQKHIEQFIVAFGDVKIVEIRSTPIRVEYSAPSFIIDRIKFIQEKLQYCKNWGCN